MGTNAEAKLQLSSMYGEMRQPLKIKVKYHDGELEHLYRTEKGDWVDLRSRLNIEAKAGEVYYIPLGVSMELPEGYEAYVMPRSSSFKKFGFIQTNSVGLIDESYKGDSDEWLLPVIFVVDGHIKKGDRICQFRIQKKMPEVEFVTVNHLQNKARNGLGSTGTN